MYGTELTCVCMEHLVFEEENESLLYAAMFGNNEKPVHVSCRVGNVDVQRKVFLIKDHRCIIL